MKAKLKETFWLIVEFMVAIAYIPVDYFRELFNLKSNTK